MGVLIGVGIIGLWLGHLLYSLLVVVVDLRAPWFLLHMIVQGYLFTGLFITAHDAMHGTVSKNRAVNTAIGAVSAFLFAGFLYKRMLRNHIAHHRFVATEGDPDYVVGNQNFFVWFGRFFVHYTHVLQIVAMAIIFNVLRIWVPVPNLILLWIVPAFLGTFQLFYFGTYRPHRLPHTEEMEPHRSRTLKKNHLAAMLSCYFFGYHWEHHQWPRTPWWRLAARKDEYLAMRTTQRDG